MTTSPTSPAPTAGSVPVVTLGGAPFCSQLTSASSKLAQIASSAASAAVPGGASATLQQEAKDEEGLFATLAGEAPAAIKQPVGDLADFIKKLVGLEASVGTAGTDVAAEQQAVQQLEQLETTTNFTADGTAISQWIAAHCTAS